MMVFLLVVIEVGGVGLLRAALGPSGLLVELAVLLVAGWLAVAASRFSVGATWIGILGLPIALGINLWLGDAISWRMSAVAAVTGSGLMLMRWRARTTERTGVEVSVP